MREGGIKTIGDKNKSVVPLGIKRENFGRENRKRETSTSTNSYLIERFHFLNRQERHLSLDSINSTIKNAYIYS